MWLGEDESTTDIKLVKKLLSNLARLPHPPNEVSGRKKGKPESYNIDLKTHSQPATTRERELLGFTGQRTTPHNAPSQKSILYKISNNTLNIGRKLLIVFE